MATPAERAEPVDLLEDPQARFRRWTLPVFDAPADAPPTAQALEDIEAAAYEEGRRRGYEDGRLAGREDMRREAARLGALIEQIARPLAQLDDEVERALVDLACAIARRLLDDELRGEPARVVALARAALAALPPDLRDIRLYLHPQDAQLARGELLPPPDAQHFRIVEDAALARGDCRVQTESTWLDARLDTRIALAAAALRDTP
ncbi:FliH/SctL family protein [Solimonas soli]|uniref:FliH/SctL family protein n=1 Tax=Solimonas soli TaxID=413479 RepID=UPI0004B938C8|nr:FliH/SctL family protein [Solimonas soli]